jgi:hypothetical protein
MAIPAVELLGTVAPTGGADTRGPRRLTVQDVVARLGISPLSHALVLAQHIAQVFPRTIEPPPPEVVGNRLPGWERTWQKSPLIVGHVVEDEPWWPLF